MVFDLHDAIANLPGSTKAREILVQHALRYLDSLSHEARDDWALEHELAVAYAKIGDVQGRPDVSEPRPDRRPRSTSYERSLFCSSRAAAASRNLSGYPSGIMILGPQRMADFLGRMGLARGGG